jgi:hypothetical protein
VERLDLKTLERVGVNALHPHLLNIAPCSATVFFNYSKKLPAVAPTPTIR